MKEFFKDLLRFGLVACCFGAGYHLFSFVCKINYYSKTISRDGVIVTRSLRVDTGLEKKEHHDQKEEEIAKNELGKVRRI